MPFLDNIRVKGPYTTYNNKEALPRIQRYVCKHILNLNKTIDQIKHIGACIRAKSQFCYNRINVVRFICRYNSQTPLTLKVIKILKQPPYRNVTEGKAFIRICVYYQIQIKDFAIITMLIYQLFRKNVKQNQGIEQDRAIDTLKTALTTTLALYKIQYRPGQGEIYVRVDVSFKGQGRVMGQFNENKKQKVS